MLKYLRQIILIFYFALIGNTVYLFIRNLDLPTDVYALLFQVLILSVCGVGFVSTLLNFRFIVRYNHIVIFTFSVIFGLALLNAIFFGELRLVSIREVILYTLIMIIDSLMIKDIINANKNRRGNQRL